MLGITTSRLFVLIALLALAGCGGGSGSAKRASGGTSDTLTERQRDSILSTSRIPGARGVGAAMRAADATSAEIRSADSVTQ